MPRRPQISFKVSAAKRDAVSIQARKWGLNTTTLMLRVVDEILAPRATAEVDEIVGRVADALGRRDFPLDVRIDELDLLRRVLAFLRGTKSDDEIRQQFDLLLRLFERRA